MAIKVYLDERLRARGITAKELCARVGITEANLSILRSGKAKGVRFHTINRIWVPLPWPACWAAAGWRYRRARQGRIL